MDEWKETALGEVLDFGNGKSRPLEEGSIPVYGGNGILGYTNRSNYSGKTIAIGRVGAYCGAVYFEDGPVWISDNALAAKAKAGNDSLFFYYLLKNADLNQHAGGSSHPLVTQTLLNSLEFSMCRDEDDQRAIASVLSSLDAKITLLHRQNKTLEAMAETLFRQWFVEQQWEERAIEEVAIRVACGPFGSSIKTDTFVDKGVPIISGQHLWGVLMEDSTFNYVTPEHADRLGKAKVRRGDVIFTHAGSIGQAALIPETSRYEEYVLSQRQFFMRCDRSKVLPLYITMYFHTREGKHQLLGNTSTSGVPSIARPVSFLRSLLVPVPQIEVQQEFEQVVGALYAKVQANNREANTLAKLRDTLLPKLMSGEVRVEVTLSKHG